MIKKQGSDRIEPAEVDFVEVAGTQQPVPKVDVNPASQYADENRRFTNVTTVTRTPGGRLWSGFQSEDGTIYISYDRNRKEKAEMLLARFTEEDVLAGKGVSERFARRLLINKTGGVSGNVS